MDEQTLQTDSLRGHGRWRRRKEVANESDALNNQYFCVNVNDNLNNNLLCTIKLNSTRACMVHMATATGSTAQGYEMSFIVTSNRAP